MHQVHILVQPSASRIFKNSVEIFIGILGELSTIINYHCPLFHLLQSVFMYIQGVRGQSGFFNWALRERNIQVRLYLKVVLKS